MKLINRLGIVVFFSLLLTNCAVYDYTHRDSQQGNLLSKKTVSRLREGMTKEDVTRILGSSLITPDFDANEWAYVYTFEKHNKITTTKRLILSFKNNKLVSVRHRI